VLRPPEGSGGDRSAHEPLATVSLRNAALRKSLVDI
jgi:hypothetical protein